MTSKLDAVLEKARTEAVNKESPPGVVAAIKQLETEDIQRLFQPATNVPKTRLVRVAVGGVLDGQEFLNADGIK